MTNRDAHGLKTLTSSALEAGVDLAELRVGVMRTYASPTALCHNAGPGACAAAQSDPDLRSASHRVSDLLASTELLCGDCEWAPILVHTLGASVLLTSDVPAQVRTVLERAHALSTTVTLEDLLVFWNSDMAVLHLVGGAAQAEASAAVFALVRRHQRLVSLQAAATLFKAHHSSAGRGDATSIAELTRLEGLPQSASFVLASRPWRVGPYGTGDLLGFASLAWSVPGTALACLPEALFELMLARNDLTPEGALVLPELPPWNLLETTAVLLDPHGSASVATPAGAYEVASAL